MIEITGIKVPVCKDSRRLEQQIMRILHLKRVPEYRILKRSIDARKKPDIYYIYNIGVELPEEEQILQKINNKNVMLTKGEEYRFPSSGTEEITHHPLIILAQRGYVPVIAERGMSVDERVREVNAFFDGKPLNTECNVQFGEGGAGTFSDGKLNTQVKDKYGRIRYV